MVALRSEKGLTLVETLAALTVFAIMTLGLTPLLLSSVRGSNLSRSFTIGKNVAVHAMEHVRGLPYSVSVGTATPLSPSPPRRDVLDFYFPDAAAGSSGSGYDSATKTFTTICDGTTELPSASGPAACSSGLPDEVRLTFVAAFVEPVNGTTPEEYSSASVDVPSTYNWNTSGTETPPSEVLQMTVTVSWEVGGRARSFDLTSLIGNRKLSEEELRGEAKIDYAVQLSTSYVASSGQASTATLTVGETTAAIDTRSIIGADFTSTTGKLNLVNKEFGTDPGGPLDDLVGAGQTLAAPPNNPAAADATATEATLQHPVLLEDIGFLNDSKVTGGGVQVVAGEPKATGSFEFHEGNQDSVWLDNQAETGSTSPLKLSDSEPIVLLHSLGSRQVQGSTYAESTSVDSGAGRKVQATTHMEFDQLDLFPSSFLSSSAPVMRVSDFVADLDCFSTTNSATATVSGSWSGDLTYWDAGPDGSGVSGDLSDDVYQTISLSGNLSGVADPFATLISANPLVYDDLVDDMKDVHLFEDLSAGKKGYLRSLSAVTKFDSLVDSSGRHTSASLNGALRIETVPTKAGVEESALSVEIGKLSCEAVDSRGL